MKLYATKRNIIDVFASHLRMLLLESGCQDAVFNTTVVQNCNGGILNCLWSHERQGREKASKANISVRKLCERLKPISSKQTFSRVLKTTRFVFMFVWLSSGTLVDMNNFYIKWKNSSIFAKKESPVLYRIKTKRPSRNIDNVKREAVIDFSLAIKWAAIMDDHVIHYFWPISRRRTVMKGSQMFTAETKFAT